MRTDADRSSGPRRRTLRRWMTATCALAVCALASTGTAPIGAADIAAGAPWPGGRWQPGAEQYGTTIVSDVPVRMDDGITLNARIGYPADKVTGQRAAGTFPVLLAQNPYLGPTQIPDSFFVAHGYIFVSVDIRGTLDSRAPGDAPLPNGLFSPRQAQDGVALVNWAAHDLAGSNGVVGLTGCSQLGIDQFFTAALLGPDSPVKAILPACAANNYDIYFAGGIPGQTIDLFDSPVTGLLSGPRHYPENLVAGQETKREVLAGGPRAYNGAYWRERTTSPEVMAAIVANDIPALLWSGWKAPDATGSLEEFAALQNAWAGRDPAAPMTTGQPRTGRYQIVVGPWGHGEGLDNNIQLQWYDTWLKGQDTGIADTDTPAHLFVNGAQRWVNTGSYPVSDRHTSYHLGAGGSLANTKSEGADAIRWGKPEESGTTVTYTTAPLPGDTTLAGPVSTSVHASSSNTNLELIATLYDVAPDGASTPLTSGTLLGSLRDLDEQNSWRDSAGTLIRPVHPYASDDYLVPDQVERFDIKLGPVAATVAAGHALRLTISTQASESACGGASLLSLSAAVPCLLTTPQRETLTGGRYRIEHSQQYPSSLVLPVTAPGDLIAADAPPGSTAVPRDWGPPARPGA